MTNRFACIHKASYPILPRGGALTSLVVYPFDTVQASQQLSSTRRSFRLPFLVHITRRPAWPTYHVSLRSCILIPHVETLVGSSSKKFWTRSSTSFEQNRIWMLVLQTKRLVCHSCQGMGTLLVLSVILWQLRDCHSLHTNFLWSLLFEQRKLTTS